MNRFLRPTLALALLVLLCVGCNLLAPHIDTARMRENAAQGCSLLEEEGATPQLVGGFRTSQPDNFTAVLILKTAAYTGGETALQRAFGGYRTDLPAAEGESGWEAFCHYADGRESPTGGLSYSRYWHGYTLPLRLLLYIFNFSNLRMLLYAAQLSLLALLLCRMKGSGLSPLVPGFLAAFFLTMPAVTGLCLQFVPMSLLSLGGGAFLLGKDRTERLCLPACFAALGILTAWLDLMTAPTLSLALPLTLVLALRLRRGDGASRLLRLSLGCCVAWGLGYAGMWALKWVLNGLVFGWGYAAGVWEQIELRLSGQSHGVSFTRLQALLRNANLILAKPAYLLLLGAAGLASLLPALRRSHRPDARALILLIPGLAALCWMLLTPNHIHDHAYFTYRNLAGALFSLLAALSLCVGSGALSPNTSPDARQSIQNL